MANTVSILLVDDHIVFRNGVRLLLETNSDFSIIGEAGSGQEALALIEQLHPDVVILDWVMPGMSGLEVLQQLSGKQSKTHVLFLSMYKIETYIASAMKNHAAGYILKDDIVADLSRAIRSVEIGKFFTSSSLNNSLPDQAGKS